ncbi:unnamed protein product [Mesocestoides corti]|uniref:Small ribosomal subunit protein mS29 n=1 Tax=Mesocestoides corti TaxID=53468 RepID=A0A0R3U2F7_MESCO|nr:unnamed protein product [Mesocestoides corti]
MNALVRVRLLACGPLHLMQCPLSTAPQTTSWVTTRAPRTDLVSPAAQLANPAACIGRFYSVPEDIASRVVAPFLKEELLREFRLFEDFSLLVRKPALDVMSALETVRQDVGSVPRFVFYGQPGCGTSVQLAHIAHYAAEKNAFLFAFCNAENWLDRCSDFTASDAYHQNQHKLEIDGDALDFPSRSAEWLRSFLKLNLPLLEKIKPVTTRAIEWTVKDIAPAGTPWLELINFGLSRTKYSTDCIGILLREMRAISSEETGPSSYLFVDGVNFLWCRGTRMQDKILLKKVAVDRLAIVHHLRRALIGDWKHGAIITSVNERGAWPSDREKYTPGQRGFETMDPFIPVNVPNYSPNEMDAVLHFYAEHDWFANPAALRPEGRAEIVFLSDANPRELAKVVSEW